VPVLDQWEDALTAFHITKNCVQSNSCALPNGHGFQLCRLNPPQKPDETLDIRRLENGLVRTILLPFVFDGMAPIPPSKVAPRHQKI
jgi:hypothetical protein